MKSQYTSGDGGNSGMKRAMTSQERMDLAYLNVKSIPTAQLKALLNNAQKILSRLGSPGDITAIKEHMSKIKVELTA